MGMVLKQNGRKSRESLVDPEGKKRLERGMMNIVSEYEKDNRIKSSKPSSSTYYGNKRSAEENSLVRKYIDEHFHPSAVSWLKDNFGIVLSKLDLDTIHDLCVGSVTKPIKARVTPIGYDYNLQKQINGKPIDIVCSFMFKFPHSKVGDKYVMSDISERKPFVCTYPVYPYMERSSEAVTKSDVADGKKPVVFFSNEEFTALSCIGISKERVFNNNKRVGALTYDDKELIKNGDPFNVRGHVLTECGYLDIYGTAQLSKAEDGSISADFESSYPVKIAKDDVLDIVNARYCGNVDIDIYARNKMNNTLKKDSDGLRVLNEAASELVEYGYALQPMVGFEHHITFGPSTAKVEDKVERHNYIVAVVNGGLIMKKMDGDIVPGIRLNEDNTITFGYGKNKQVLEFEDKAQLDSYLAGKGGFVKSAKFVTYGEVLPDGKRMKNETVYRGFVLADIKKGFFPRLFSPERSEKIALEREKKEKLTARKKQNFKLSK